MTSSFSNNMPPQVVTARIFTEKTAAYLDQLRFAASEAIRTFEDAGDAMSWAPTQNAIDHLKEVLQGGYEYHSDDAAVDRFAEAMRDKMEESREKGRSGWDSPFQCSPYRLAGLLIDHIAKGDPVDVGNFAMMLFNRPDSRGVLARVWSERFGLAASPAAHGKPVAWVRFCSDGTFEGPIMDSDKRMDGVRRTSGAWTPLGLMGASPADQVEDARMLDWLDEQNRKKNESHGTRFGWRYSVNHNRIALEDHCWPPITVREAIRAAMSATPPAADAGKEPT